MRTTSKRDTNVDWTEAVESFLQDSDFAPSTRATYRRALAAFCEWYAGTYNEDPEPELVNEEDARDWRSYLSGVRKLSASAVNLHLAALRGLARSCDNPLEVKGVKQVQRPVETLTGHERGRLIRALKGDHWIDKRNVAIVSLMVRAGLRVSEVLDLSPKDVTINERSGSVLVHRGKGRKERMVPLSLQVRKELAAYLKERQRKWGKRSDARLFLTKTGGALSSRTVQRMVEAAAQQARIDKEITPHTLRHTFSFRFLEKQTGDGKSAAAALAVLQKILGHKNISTTSRYLHPDAAQMQEMVEEM